MLFRGIFVFIVVTQYTTQILLSQQSNNITVITIDRTGNSSSECCTGRENCACSNLSFALQHINSNTEIQVNSNISLYTTAELDKVIYNVHITGINHPTIQCSNQSGIHGKFICSMVIQDIKWEKCGLILTSSKSTEIVNCHFQHSEGEFALVIVSSTAHVESSTFVENNNGLSVHLSNVTIHKCAFNANSGRINYKNKNDHIANVLGHGIHCSCSNLQLNFSHFINNTNSGVVLVNSQLAMSGNATFYNNGVNNSTEFVNVMETYKEPCIYSTTVELATENGGAVSLINSTMCFHQGTFIFNKNSAGNGGAIYIGRNSSIQFSNDSTDTKLEFFNNTAAYLGGALYINIDTNINKIPYYYNILTSATRHNDSNIAYKGGSYTYFNINVSTLIQCQSSMPEKAAEYGNLFASSVCSITNDFNNAAVKVNKSDYTNGSVSFWLHDLNLNLVAKDCFGHLIIPFEGTLSCNNTHCKGNGSCDERYKKEFHYVIENVDDNIILTLKNAGSIGCCCLNNYGSSVITLTALSFRIPVTVIWTIPTDECNDNIGHYNLSGTCLPTSCDNLFQTASFPPGLSCPNGYITAVPSYWYDNGFKSYISSCPSDNCNLNYWYTKILLDPFPRKNLQCNDNWKGFACGECNYNANYSIKYDTPECVSVSECLLHTSVTHSLLILFAVSFFYWIAMISFIFVLLHFKFFNVKAGYGYGIIFYYSVLEHIVVVFNEIVQTEIVGFQMMNIITSVFLFKLHTML